MPLTEAEIKAFAPEKKTNYTDGAGLYLVVDPKVANGGKYFVGRSRYPAGRAGKQIEIRIGTFGRHAEQLTLKQARDEWQAIKTWSKETGRDPRDRKKDAQLLLDQEQSVPSLAEYAEVYLQSISGRVKPTTVKDYRNILENTVLPALGGHSRIADFTFSKSRLRVVGVAEDVAKRGAASYAQRVLMVMRQMFELAISDALIQGDNPAIRSPRLPKPRVKHHPHLGIDELRDFLADLNERESSLAMVTSCAIRWTLMTLLRVSASCSLKWDHIDWEKKIWVIPGSTTGVKRTLKYSDIDHVVPLTPQMETMLNRLREINGNRSHAFYSVRSRHKPFMNPFSLNPAVKSMGYQGRLDVHGMRRTAGTALCAKGWDWQVVSRQLGHLKPEDCGLEAKLRAAYDANDPIDMDERRQVLTDWNELLVELGMVI